MIKKLIISVAVLAALISSKEANAFSAGGFARELASSSALPSVASRISVAEPNSGDNGAIVALDSAKRDELLRVNSAVNGTIDALDSYFDGFAGDHALEFGNADCRDCAELKRQQLVALGWSEQALRIAYAVGNVGQIERVLVVATDRGEIFLGNETPVIAEPGDRKQPAVGISRKPAATSTNI